MGLWRSLRDFLAGYAGGGRWAVEYVGPTVPQVMGMGPEQLYRTQPHLRTVISFLARNIAQLPLHVYERASDTDRRRVTEGPVAELLKQPNPDQTIFELLFQTVADLKLYGYAVWMPTNGDDGWRLRTVPPAWIKHTGGGNPYAPEWIELSIKNQRVILKNELGKPREFIEFVGYTPGAPGKGSSPVEALKEILAEQIQAWTYRQQVWQRGGRVGAYLTRPVDAPRWSAEGREKFSRDWSSKWTGPDGPKAGGTPILEEGMELHRLGFAAREEEWSEVAKLSLATVAAVYHTSPTMVGILDNANYANVREFSRMLYTDTLGPDLALLEQRVNAFLLPLIGAPKSAYVEFNLQAKLAGSFEEQAAVMSTSVGRPWMTADEARARLNMPALGGDAAALVTPLNVLVGGQASPRDSGSQNRSSVDRARLRAKVRAGVVLKAAGREEDSAIIEAVLGRFFRRQRDAVLSRLGAKSADWWDEDRWDDELADDLYRLAATITAELGKSTLRDLGVDPDEYDVDRTLRFLRAVAESRARMLNATTRAQLEAALADDLVDEDAERATPEGVFDQAEGSRSTQSALTFATTLAGFAMTEAVGQLGRPGVTKTWLTTSANPRPSHRAMSGETVGIDENYSNGMAWPGDIAGNGDPSEIANCSCISELYIP